MSGDLGALTFAALGIALSPMPFVLALALVASDGPRRRAPAFVSGEALAIAGVLAAVLFVIPVGDPDAGGVGRTIAALELTVGLGFVALLIVHLRRPREGASWEHMLGRVDTRVAFLGGVAMIVANPKNLALALAGGAAILRLDTSGISAPAILAGFTLSAVSVLVAAVAAAALFPERSEVVFDRSSAFILRRQRLLGAVLLGALAAFFLAHGLRGLGQ